MDILLFPARYAEDISEWGLITATMAGIRVGMSIYWSWQIGARTMQIGAFQITFTLV